MSDDGFPPDWNAEKQKAYEEEAQAYWDALDYGHYYVSATTVQTCDHCGYELDELPGGSFVHKLSRSTRCCNEKPWHMNKVDRNGPNDEYKMMEDHFERELEEERIPAKAFLCTKPSRLERVLQFLFG